MRTSLFGGGQRHVTQKCSIPGYTVLYREANRSAEAKIADRFLDFKANTSSKRPEELEGSEELLTEAPELLARLMKMVRRRHGLKILGECCGTDTGHIEQISKKYKEKA